jgi:hypothetical protein
MNRTSLATTNRHVYSSSRKVGRAWSFQWSAPHLLIDWFGDVVHLECTRFCWLFQSKDYYIPSSNLLNLITSVRHGDPSGARSSLVPHFLHFRLRLPPDWVCRPIGTFWPFDLICRYVVQRVYAQQHVVQKDVNLLDVWSRLLVLLPTPF